MTNEEAQIIIGNIPIKPEVLDDCYDITEYQEAKTMAIKALEQQPKTGHWSDECECSVCGNQPWYEGSTFRKNYKFCPYCGAKMAEGSDE